MTTDAFVATNILSSLLHDVVTKLDSNEAIKFITGNAQNVIDGFTKCLQAVVLGDNSNDYVYLASAVTSIKARTDVLITQITEIDDPKDIEALVAEYVGNIRGAVKELVSCLRIQ
jgi:hypothetical protein